MPEDEVTPAAPTAPVAPADTTKTEGKKNADLANAGKDDAKSWDEARKIAEKRNPIKSAQKAAPAADKPEEAKPADAAADEAEKKDTPAAASEEETPPPNKGKASKAWANLKRLEREMKAELASKEAEIAQQQTLVKGAQELAELVQKDPLAALQRLGLSAKSVVEHGLKHDEDARLTPEQRRLVELEKWKADREAEEKKSEENRQQQAREGGRTAALERIGAEFPKVAENYPLVAVMDESVRRHEVLAIINRHSAKVLATIQGASDPDSGRSLAIQRAFRTLESRLRKEHEQRSKAYSESYGKTAKPADAGNGARSNAGRKTKPEGNGEPKGLSNRDAASPSTGGTPLKETAAEARRRLGANLKLVGG